MAEGQGNGAGARRHDDRTCALAAGMWVLVPVLDAQALTHIETPGGSYQLKGGSSNAELLIESETDPDDITRLRLIDGPERALSS